jgi:hypothetical protein
MRAFNSFVSAPWRAMVAGSVWIARKLYRHFPLRPADVCVLQLGYACYMRAIITLAFECRGMWGSLGHKQTLKDSLSGHACYEAMQCHGNDFHIPLPKPGS